MPRIHRKSMPRTVLSASPIRRATCRAEALSHACPAISSNRLLNGAFVGNCSTFSVRIPQPGHRTQPGQPRIFLQSLSLKLASAAGKAVLYETPSEWGPCQILAHSPTQLSECFV